MPNHLRKSNIMEDKENTSPNGDGHFFPSSGRKKTIANSEHVSKLVHRFYFVKLWPTDPDSVPQIKKEENKVKKMNQDILEITERITETRSGKNRMDSVLKSLNYPHKEWGNSVAKKGKTLRDLYMALDELCFVNKASNRRYIMTWFREEIDNSSLNSLMLHGGKSLAEEKQILRDINIQQRHFASFKSLDVLKNTIRWNPYLKNWQKLLREIEEFQIQWERATGNDSLKGKISNYESLKKAVEDQIKLLCDDSLENRRQWIACGTSAKRAEKELEAINGVLYFLRAKLTEKQKKKCEAYQRILKLKFFYDGEISHYYQYCSLIHKFHLLAEEKDVATLDDLWVGKFMLEWNNNKAFRQDYERRFCNP